MIFPCTTWSTQPKGEPLSQGVAISLERRKGINKAVFLYAGVCQFRGIYFALPLLPFVFSYIKLAAILGGLWEASSNLGWRASTLYRLWRSGIRKTCFDSPVSPWVKGKWAAGWPRTIQRSAGELLVVCAVEGRNRYWEAVYDCSWYPQGIAACLSVVLL